MRSLAVASERASEAETGNSSFIHYDLSSWFSLLTASLLTVALRTYLPYKPLHNVPVLALPHSPGDVGKPRS
ncbi:unnamed protein product [Danaus chrysippus]|uniref:(African queen) hypothetical protein n=1 Tax=Danaus chrysippus TaxID=151541 RepID=A0A8J2VVW8_9NEOP|nr:unnamed protein product [Danaus chrysippus]